MSLFQYQAFSYCCCCSCYFSAFVWSSSFAYLTKFSLVRQITDDVIFLLHFFIPFFRFDHFPRRYSRQRIGRQYNHKEMGKATTFHLDVYLFHNDTFLPVSCFLFLFVSVCAICYGSVRAHHFSCCCCRWRNDDTGVRRILSLTVRVLFELPLKVMKKAKQEVG